MSESESVYPLEEKRILKNELQRISSEFTPRSPTSHISIDIGPFLSLNTLSLYLLMYKIQVDSNPELLKKKQQVCFINMIMSMVIFCLYQIFGFGNACTPEKINELMVSAIIAIQQMESVKNSGKPSIETYTKIYNQVYTVICKDSEIISKERYNGVYFGNCYEVIKKIEPRIIKMAANI